MNISITYQQALDKASPRLKRMMQHTCDLLKKTEPLALKYDAERGFYVGFSGGKDSQALIHMMQLAGVRFHAYFSPTSIDPPENIRFIKHNYPEVEFVKLETNIFNMFRQMKVLPSMKIRWCCSHFKERGGEGKVVCTGVRKAESVRRSKRNEIEVSGRKFSGHIDEFEQWQEKRIRNKMKNLNQDQFSEAKASEVRCINGRDKILLNPIIEWTEADVWEFLDKVVEAPHCELYDQGWTRIGCICCPMATTKNILRDAKRWPHVKEKWIRAIMDVRKESILGGPPPLSPSTERFYTLNGLYPPPDSERRQANSSGWGRLNGDSTRMSADCKHKSGGRPESMVQRLQERSLEERPRTWRDEIDQVPAKLPPEISPTPTDCSDCSNRVRDWGGGQHRQNDLQRTAGRFFGKRHERSLTLCRRIRRGEGTSSRGVYLRLVDKQKAVQAVVCRHLFSAPRPKI